MEFDTDDISVLSRRLFEAAGVTPVNAVAVVDHLIENSLMGLHSHGVMRVPEYLGRIEAFGTPESPQGGPIDPVAEPSVDVEEMGHAVVNGNAGFGQIAALAAVDVVWRLANRYGISVVSVRNAGHVGRLGAYPEQLAGRGLVGLAFCSSPIGAHRVSPFGGRDGRMATNPIAYAFPTSTAPVVADFATSAYTEGGIRYRRNQGMELPTGVLVDADGRPTTDPNVLYADPPGTIQPFGGDLSGHKGSALGLLVDVMATLVAGDSVTDPERIGNNVTLIGIQPESDFTSRAETFAAYIRSARPIDPTSPVKMPGDKELEARRRAETVTVDEVTWREMANAARSRELDLPHPVAVDATSGSL